MKFIVPAKTNSTRVLDKNWREFSGGRSLVQICVEKLLPLGEVIVSCEDPGKVDEVLGWGARMHLREEGWTDNDFPLTDWIRGTHEDLLLDGFLESDEDVGWAQVTSPLFDDYEDMLYLWEQSDPTYDSMVAVYPHRGYWLDENFRPVGWGWGEWHTKGQRLPMGYQMPWVFSILTPESVRRTGYHIGASPFWYISQSPAVDIDTEHDWNYAKYIYEERYGVNRTN